MYKNNKLITFLLLSSSVFIYSMKRKREADLTTKQKKVKIRTFSFVKELNKIQNLFKEYMKASRKFDEKLEKEIANNLIPIIVNHIHNIKTYELDNQNRNKLSEKVIDLVRNKYIENLNEIEEHLNSKQKYIKQQTYDDYKGANYNLLEFLEENIIYLFYLIQNNKEYLSEYLKTLNLIQKMLRENIATNEELIKLSKDFFN